MQDRIVIGGEILLTSVADGEVNLTHYVDGNATLSFPVDGEIGLIHRVDGEVTLHHMIDGQGEKYMPYMARGYEGEYNVTPSEEEQVLPMAGLMASQNVTVAPIPKNYGRILYNGSTITVY